MKCTSLVTIATQGYGNASALLKQVSTAEVCTLNDWKRLKSLLKWKKKKKRKKVDIFQACRKVGLFTTIQTMTSTATDVLKRLIQKVNLTYISYVGYPADQEVPYPETFLEGYHKCIEDLTHEAERIEEQLND